jgi:Tol biopolymer transport system component
MSNVIINKEIIVKILLSVVVFLTSCRSGYRVFDHCLPGMEPKIYASDILGRDSSYVGYCSFGRNGYFYYAVTNRQWDFSRILKLSPDGRIDTVKFNINNHWEGEPFVAPDGKRMYFTAIRPPKENPWHADIFYVDKTDSGWSKPSEFLLNSPASEWHLSMSKRQTVYFASEREGGRLKADIYYSVPESGVYKTAIKLPYPVNSEYNDCDPLIAPDESYLIFHSDRPGGYGEHDLYITFNKGNNHWTEPKNMGKLINSEGWEMAPGLSPDGKYLFFTRRKSWNTSKPSRIYWVNIKIIGSYK